ncbi:MAG TPA: galactokinase family protein [Baekduia sp.]|uniref:galactokinase n=1 Tax=Baekduia sp. TaxID=2600305 RepID=UPI002D79CA78|nr:galactokinase family protein [Baekduia sp.]HET6506256.1 galactokinase family protein [Baekduia sp.]
MTRITAFGPGRVNLIGEHTDYNGGLALPFAIAEGVTVVAEAAEGDEVTAVAHDFDGETDTFPVADPPRGADGWRPFVRGIVAELEIATAARLEIRGDLAQGSGLSSSAALEVALALALLGLEDREIPRDELARLCSRVENNWVGAQTGLLDQTASLLATDGHALRIDFATMETTSVPLDLKDHVLVTVDSGDHHSLSAANGYNERRAECDEAAERLGVATISEATEEQAAALPEPLRRRVRHVLTENARVDATVAALAAGDLPQVGRLLNDSHRSLRDDYEASTDRVEQTVKRLKDAGALGARMVGGGFGGHVLALFPPGAPLPDDAHEVRPGPGARLL